ncbi:MAG: hypothetical protein ACI87E_001755, partial [Mariniblastus sp.]
SGSPQKSPAKKRLIGPLDSYSANRLPELQYSTLF